MIFINKQKKVEALLAEYRNKVTLCLETFQNAFRQYGENPDRSVLEKNFTDIHKAESMADDIRREVEYMMYSKALFPESRGDILGLLETMDKVPNQTESAARTLFNQHIVIPQELLPQMLQLVDVCHRCVIAMLEGSEKLFTDFSAAPDFLELVDRLESEADIIEADMIEKIFSSDMDGTEKILLRDLIKHVAQISDRAENVGDRIRIIVAKRRI